MSLFKFPPELAVLRTPYLSGLDKKVILPYLVSVKLYKEGAAMRYRDNSTASSKILYKNTSENIP